MSSSLSNAFAASSTFCFTSSASLAKALARSFNSPGSSSEIGATSEAGSDFVSPKTSSKEISSVNSSFSFCFKAFSKSTASEATSGADSPNEARMSSADSGAFSSDDESIRASKSISSLAGSSFLSTDSSSKSFKSGAISEAASTFSSDLFSSSDGAMSEAGSISLSSFFSSSEGASSDAGLTSLFSISTLLESFLSRSSKAAVQAAAIASCSALAFSSADFSSSAAFSCSPKAAAQASAIFS